MLAGIPASWEVGSAPVMEREMEMQKDNESLQSRNNLPGEKSRDTQTGYVCLCVGE